MNGKADVWGAVEKVRAQHTKDLGRVPVDVLTCIEVRMGIDVIPFENLLSKYSVDAAVTPDFTGIYVDKKSYQILDKGKPPWMFNRLRFSLAHELGHVVLHGDLVKGMPFKTIAEFIKFTQSPRKGKYSLEWEANEFAGRLIVPGDRLRADFDKFAEVMEKKNASWFANVALREGLAESLAANYQVSKDVVRTRLEREEIWPLS